jgi:hypothetical protein
MANFFSTLFGGGAEAEAADKNRMLAQQYGKESQGYLTSGYDTGVTNLNKGVAAYDPLVNLATNYNKAGALNLDALGVNGPEGTTRATGAFQTTPGYDLTQKAALEALDRKHAISGNYASGNADIDTTNWITKNLYETQYAPWMAGLERAGAQGGQYTATAAGGQAGGYGALSNLAQNYAQSQTGVAGNVTSGLADANKLQAAGEASGAKNLLGAGLSLASLAAGPIGGAFGGALAGGGSGPIVPGSATTGHRPLYG